MSVDTLRIDRSDITPQLEVLRDGMSQSRFPFIRGIVDSLEDRCNPVFRGAAFAGDGSILVTPFADDESVDGLMENIPRLEGPRPTVLVYANSSNESDRGNSQAATLRELGRRCTRAEIPLAYTDVPYPPSTAIGRIRYDMADVALLSYLMRPVAHPDKLLLSSDADLVSMPRDYLLKAQANFAASPLPAWLGGPTVSHQRPERSRFPRIATLLKLYDEITSHNGSVVPTQYGVNVGAYAVSDGINEYANFGEIAGLLANLRNIFGQDQVAYNRVGSNVQVSARHLIYRMLQGDDQLEYEPLELRRNDKPAGHRNFALSRDITRERFEQLFVERLEDAYGVALRRGRSSHDQAASADEIERGARLFATETLIHIGRMLYGLDGSTDLVNKTLDRLAA